MKIPGVDCVVVRGSYDCLPLQNVVTKLKYSYWSGLHDILPELLRPLVDEKLLPADAVIVPVPLHTRRRRERGFNQAELIAHALSHVSGLPMIQTIERIRYTTPQAQLSAKQRQTNIIGAFGQGNMVVKKANSVILVDDVITTGSTVAECATALRRQGVSKITALALAKG